MNERIKNGLNRLKISTDGTRMKPLNIKSRHHHEFPNIDGFNPKSVKCITCDMIDVYVPGGVK